MFKPLFFMILLFGALLFGAFCLLPGCTVPPSYTQADITPIYTADGARRSLVADAPIVTEQRTAQRPGDLPWYHTRNDQGPAIIAGVRSTRTQSAYTHTSDRLQSTSGGRVFDNYNQTTRRSRFIETVD